MAVDYAIFNCAFLCIMFTAFCSTTSDFCNRISIHNDSKSWLDAKRNCFKSNQVLLKPTHINELKSCPGNYDHFWIDKYFYLSNWMEIYGCYTWVNNSLNGIFSPPSFLRPAICERACRQSEFFGIKEDDCICINKTFKEQYLSRISSSHCVKPCDFESHLYCGGEQALNLYKRVHSNNVHSQNNDKRCSSLECKSNMIGLEARECGTPIRVLCSDGNVSNLYTNWEEQMAYCRTRNYPYKSQGNPVVFCNKMGYSPSWSGVFRSLINGTHKWLPLEHDCFKLTKEVNGYTSTTSNCTEKQKYICVEEVVTDITGSSLQTQTTVDVTTGAITNINNSNNISKISTNSGSGVIAGSVIGVIGVIACVVLVIFLIKKRIIRFLCLKSKDVEKEEKRFDSVIDRKGKAETSENEANENHIYTEDNNQEYENVNPLDSERNQEYANVNPLDSERNQEYANVNPLDINRNQEYEIVNSHSNSADTADNSSRDDHEYITIIGDDVHVYKNTIEDEYEICQNKEKS